MKSLAHFKYCILLFCMLICFCLLGIDNYKYVEAKNKLIETEVCGNINYELPQYYGSESNRYKVSDGKYEWSIVLSNNTDNKPVTACTTLYNLIGDTYTLDGVGLCAGDLRFFFSWVAFGILLFALIGVTGFTIGEYDGKIS
jgi:hypothetical protein